MLWIPLTLHPDPLVTHALLLAHLQHLSSFLPPTTLLQYKQCFQPPVPFQHIFQLSLIKMVSSKSFHRDYTPGASTSPAMKTLERSVLKHLRSVVGPSACRCFLTALPSWYIICIRGHEADYRSTVDSSIEWWGRNHLQFHVCKKEPMVDFWRRQPQRGSGGDSCLKVLTMNTIALDSQTGMSILETAIFWDFNLQQPPGFTEKGE